MKIVTVKIHSEINRALWEEFYGVETDSRVFQERMEWLEAGLRNMVSLDDAWNYAVNVANLWIPAPQSKALEYNTVEYNTVEIFCLCVHKAKENN